MFSLGEVFGSVKVDGVGQGLNLRLRFDAGQGIQRGGGAFAGLEAAKDVLADEGDVFEALAGEGFANALVAAPGKALR